MAARHRPASPRELWPTITIDTAPVLGDQLRTRDRARAKRDRLEQCKRIVEETIPALFSNSAPATPIELSAAALEELLRRLAQASPDAYRGWHGLLRAVLAAATKQGWYSGPLPDLIVRVSALGSPITPSNFPLAASADQSRWTFLAKIPALDLQRPEVLAGATLASAILFGGLLDPGMLAKLACMHPLPLQSFAGWHWLDLESIGSSEQGRGHRGSATRRWLPDPVTCSLLLRWLAKGTGQSLTGCTDASDRKEVQKTVWLLIRPLLLDCTPSLRSSINSLPALLKAMELAFRLHLSPLLVNFARGTLDSWSLPSHAWLRLISRRRAGPARAVAREQDASATAEAPDPTPEFQSPLPSRRDAQYKTLRKALKILRESSGESSVARAKLQRVLDSNDTALVPIVSML